MVFPSGFSLDSHGVEAYNAGFAKPSTVSVWSYVEHVIETGQSHETNVSTEQAKTSQETRISAPYVQSWRTTGHPTASIAWSKTTLGLKFVRTK